MQIACGNDIQISASDFSLVREYLITFFHFTSTPDLYSIAKFCSRSIVTGENIYDLTFVAENLFHKFM